MAVWQSTRNLLYQSFQSRLWDSCFDCIAFPGGLCYTLLRGLRQSTSGIFGFYVGTTGGFYRDLRPSAPRIFGFHVGFAGGLYFYGLNAHNIVKDFPLIRFDGRQHIRFIGVLPDLHLEPPFFKTFREMGVISAHISLKRRFSTQTKIPEKPGVKPLFGDFTLELLIRFERTTCSLRVSCSTG